MAEDTNTKTERPETVATAAASSTHASTQTRLTALVSGRVQGVGYRAFVRRFALDHDITGYAENLDDGRVEVVAQGEREDLELLLHQLKRGPVVASVKDVSATWSDIGEATTASGVSMTGFHTY